MQTFYFIDASLSWRHKGILLWAVCWLFIMVTVTTTPSAGYELTATASTSTSSTFCASHNKKINSLEVLAGTNLTIACHLSEYAAEIKSSDDKFWFEICRENLHSYEIIKPPNQQLQVLDWKSVNLMLKNLTDQRAIYTCRHGQEIISNTRLIVGSAPKKVTDLFCYNNNGVQLICEFIRPKLDPWDIEFETKYLLNYTADHYKHWGPYKNVTSVKCAEKLQTTSNNKQIICRADGQVLTAFHNYNFTLIGRNRFGATTADFVFNIYTNAISSKLNIALTTSAHSVDINIDPIGNFILDNTYYIDKMIDLQYEVGLQLSNSLSNNWEYHVLNLTALSRNFTISNLYANQNYKIRVRMRVLQDKVLWNEAFTGSLRTKSAQPIMSPTTFVGAFYANELKSQVQLFWQHIPRLLQNGTDFRYLITSTAKDGLILSSSSNESSILLNWENNLVDYYVQSSNEMGASESRSSIRVFPQSAKLHNPRNVAVVYANNSYIIYWKSPLRRHVSNYTVLWCTAKVATNNNCNGLAHFEYVGGERTNFSIPMQDISLNIAIAANFHNYSSGLQWSSCAADENTDLWQIEPEVYERQSTQLKVQWSAGNVCSIIIRGYNLTYCELLTKEENSNCRSVNVGHVYQREFVTYTITDLRPNTPYSIAVYMYSDKKVGPLSNDLHGKTIEAAPSEPRHLKHVEGSITSNSVNLTWDAPLISNGVIQKYTIWYGLRNQSKESVQIEANGDQVMSYRLESLKSYTNYYIYVTASTVAESHSSNAINLLTLIGVPSAPFHVQLSENVLTWEAPHVPSGRVDFYLVRLTIMRHNKGKNTVAYVETSLGRTFTVRAEECLDSQMTFKWQVRAINAAAAHELDNQTFSQIDMENFLTYTRDDDDDDGDENDNNNTSINCYGGEVINLDKKQMPLSLMKHGEKLKYFCSPWEDAKPFISCSVPSVKQILLPIFTFLMLIVSVMVVSLWARKKYNRMKNIGAVLPEGLSNIKPQVTNEFSVEKKSDFERHLHALMITTATTMTEEESSSTPQQLSVGFDNMVDSYTYQLGSLNTYTTMLTNNSSSSSSSSHDSEHNMRSRSLSPLSVKEANSSLTSMENILSTSPASNDDTSPYINQQLLATVVGDYVTSTTLTPVSVDHRNIAYANMTDNCGQLATLDSNFEYVQQGNLMNTTNPYKIASKNTSQEQLLHHTNSNLHENNNNKKSTAFWGYVAHK